MRHLVVEMEDAFTVCGLPEREAEIITTEADRVTCRECVEADELASQEGGTK